MTTLLAALRQATETMTGTGLLPLLFRLTVVTGIGCAALVLARHASAAVRHRIAIAALAASTALPLASLLLPTIALPVLPARTVVEPALLPGVFQTAASEKPGSDAPLLTTLSAAAAPAPSSAARPVAVLTGRDLAALAVLAGWIVSLVLLSRVLTAWLAARRMVRRATPVMDERVCAEFDGAHQRLGIRRLVALLESDRILVPVVCGIVRPALLVPPDALGWSRERLRSVMYHELAHVARDDGLALLLTRVTTAALWFHPLVWVLAHQARLTCEQACDDVVLGDGARASAYAEELLAIARDASERDPLQGLAPAFARRSTLERRLVAILAPGVRRGPASWAVSLAIGTVALVLALSLASVRVVAAPAVATPAARPIWLADAQGSASVAKDEAKRAESAAELLAGRIAPAAARRRASQYGGDQYEKGKECYDSERYLEAALAYIEAAQAGHRPAIAYYNAACSYSLDGQKDRAIETLALALDEGFDNADLIARDDDLDAIRSSPRFRQLLARARNTDPAKAGRVANLKRYERLRAEHSDDASAWRDVGIDLMRSGEPLTAVQAFAAEFAIDSSASTLYNQACAWSLAGRQAEGLKSLQRSIESGYGGVKHMQQDDDLSALHGTAGFERLLDLARDLELSGPLLGREDVRGWRNELSRYERAARDHAQLGRAWSNLGFARLATKNPEGSAEAYRRSLALGYHVSTSMYNLACAYAQMRQTDEAIRWLERAEAAGMEVRDMGLNDDDLDPIRADARFRRMADRWREERRAEKRKDWEKAQKD